MQDTNKVDLAKENQVLRSQLEMLNKTSVNIANQRGNALNALAEAEGKIEMLVEGIQQRDETIKKMEKDAQETAVESKETKEPAGKEQK